MKIVNVGYNYRHPDDFIINRPFGSGDYILLIYKTPAFIILDGKRSELGASSAIIFRKGTPQHYGALSGEFCNDWIHFDLETDEESEITDLGIPFDTVINIHNAQIITEYIKNTFVERYSESPNKEESLALLFRLILIKLSESLVDCTKDTERPYYESLLRLRSEISDFPERPRSLDSVSRSLRLSRSYVQHLYKQYFGISITEDIRNARMEYAKHLLSGTRMTVSSVSSACGYNSDVHFMRLFKQYVGVSPSEYRKSTAVQGNEIENSKKFPPFNL